MSWLLVIGGNSDIGFSTAKIFASYGYNVHLASRDMDQLNLKKKIIEKTFSVTCKISLLDLYDTESIEKFLKNNQINPKIILVAAGYMENPETFFKKIIKINYSNLLEIIEKLIVKDFHHKKLSTIIGISSIAGERGKKDNCIYSSAKAAFTLYLDGLRQRLYRKNINVLTIKPGYVDTKMVKNLNLPHYLISSPDKIGKIIFESYRKKRNIVYAPYFWKIILLVYKNIPEFVFKLKLTK
jgi:short-subunit dehydrogenase|tara:strand:- start:526 stop:1245 length:720 start_codon:yes stop_codon:yes gene_type:complete